MTDAQAIFYIHPQVLEIRQKQCILHADLIFEHVLFRVYRTDDCMSVLRSGVKIVKLLLITSHLVEQKSKPGRRNILSHYCLCNGYLVEQKLRVGKLCILDI